MFRNRRAYKNTKPRKPPTTDPYQSILNLNDDCLYEIFTYLPLQDLCSIGFTCIRINEVAKKLYGRFANLNAKHFLTKNRHNLTTERKMGFIIKEIKLHVKVFKISEKIEENNGSKPCERLIKLILIYCRNITDLKIGFRINDLFSHVISGFKNFQKLKTLYITSARIWLNNMSQLENLHLTCGGYVSDLLTIKNLKSLYLRGMTMDSNLLSQICDNNPDIKQLELPDQRFRGTNSANLTIIIDKLVHLEEIVIPYYYGDLDRSTIQRISEIKNLKRLSISNSISRLAPELLAKLLELDQLESLSYSHTPFRAWANPDDMKLITKFTKLKYLCVTNFDDIHMNSLKSTRILEHAEFNFSECVRNEGVITFIKSAINLKYLSLVESRCNDYVLELLMDLVKNCSRKAKLTVKSHFIRSWHIKDYPLLNLIVPPYRKIDVDKKDCDPVYLSDDNYDGYHSS